MIQGFNGSPGLFCSFFLLLSLVSGEDLELHKVSSGFSLKSTDTSRTFSAESISPTIDGNRFTQSTSVRIVKFTLPSDTTNLEIKSAGNCTLPLVFVKLDEEIAITTENNTMTVGAPYIGIRMFWDLDTEYYGNFENYLEFNFSTYKTLKYQYFHLPAATNSDIHVAYICMAFKADEDPLFDFFVEPITKSTVLVDVEVDTQAYKPAQDDLFSYFFRRLELESGKKHSFYFTNMPNTTWFNFKIVDDPTKKENLSFDQYSIIDWTNQFDGVSIHLYRDFFGTELYVEISNFTTDSITYDMEIFVGTIYLCEGDCDSINLLHLYPRFRLCLQIAK